MSVHFRTPRKPATTTNAFRQGLPNCNLTRVRHLSSALALSRDARAHGDVDVVIETTRTPMCLTEISGFEMPSCQSARRDPNSTCSPARLCACISRLACRVEVGADGKMMELEYCFQRCDWSIVRSL
jgi:hypothetical protein